MAKPSPNGKIRGVTKVRRHADGKIAWRDTHIGAPPRSLTKTQIKIWHQLVDELPPELMIKSHRKWMELTCRTASRFYRLSNYFLKREKECEDAGRDPAEAYLNDEGSRRHPLCAELAVAETNLMRELDKLGANLKSITEIASSLGGTIETAERIAQKNAASRYLK